MVSTTCSMAYLSRVNFILVRVNCVLSMFTMMMLRKMLSMRSKFFTSHCDMRNERSLCGSMGTSVSSTSNSALPCGAFHSTESITTSTS